MALKPCRECRKEVSTQAKTCPQCGVPHPTSQLDPGTKQALGCLALIIVVVEAGLRYGLLGGVGLPILLIPFFLFVEWFRARAAGP